MLSPTFMWIMLWDALVTVMFRSSGNLWRSAFFPHMDFSGEPVLKQTGTQSEFRWFGPVAPEVDHQAFSARLHCVYVPEETGDYEIGLMSAGTSRLTINGAPVLEAWESWERGFSYFGHGCAERRTNLFLEAGKRYEIDVEYACGDGITTTLKAVRFGLRAPSDKGSLCEAVKLAKSADVTILVAGLNDDWETEAEDRDSLSLPAAQNELIQAVVAANAKTLVVMQSGSPVVMPWADTVPAILQLWYPGQECGNALADILSGKAEPAGRLPQSFPAFGEDLSPMTDRPQPHEAIVYSEGTGIGYRGFQSRGTAPQFPFGHGLGYGKIELVNATLSNSDNLKEKDQSGVCVTVDLVNHGIRNGSEVIQVYIRSEDNPEMMLAAFTKVQMEPKQRQTRLISIPRRAFCHWDEERKQWCLRSSRFILAIGTSSTKIHFRCPISISETEYGFNE